MSARKPRLGIHVPPEDRIRFDVTHVVGTVEIDRHGGGEPPNVVAFRMVDELDVEGTFTWTLPLCPGHERRYSVVVEHVETVVPEPEPEPWGDEA